MKKLSLLFIIILCGHEIIFAQKTPKFLASVSIGVAFPVDKFGSKNFSDSSAGWALPGPVLNVSFGYHITKSTGVMLLFSGQLNKQDADVFNNGIKESNGPVTEVQTTTSSWKVPKVMAGGFFNIPLYNPGKVLLKIAVLAGGVKSYFPGYSYSGTTNPTGSPADSRSYSATFTGKELPWTFGYQVNAGINYKISSDIFLLADINYFNSDVESYAVYPRSTTVIISPGPVPLPPPQKTKFSLASLNMMVGAGIRF